MTDEELQAAVAKADERAEKLLQMPPVVKVKVILRVRQYYRLSME